jgi:hypothetical protein
MITAGSTEKTHLGSKYEMSRRHSCHHVKHNNNGQTP